MFNWFWRIKALHSAQVTTWRVLKNRITTKVELHRHGIVVESVLCCFCGAKEEEVRHLFFECRISWMV